MDDAEAKHNHKRRRSSQSPSHQQQRPSQLQQQQAQMQQPLLLRQNQGNAWQNPQNQQQIHQQLQKMLMLQQTMGGNLPPNILAAMNTQAQKPNLQLSASQNPMVSMISAPTDQQRQSMKSPSTSSRTSSNNSSNLLKFYNPVSTKRRSSSLQESNDEMPALPALDMGMVAKSGITGNLGITSPDIAASRASFQLASQSVTSPSTTKKNDSNMKEKGKSASTSPADAKTTSTETTKTGREYHYQPQHHSSLTNEQVLDIVSNLPVEERIVFSAKQLLGTGKNGFSKATSSMQRLKRQRARQMGNAGGEELDDEHLKEKTFNPRFAKKLVQETKQGIQFCNMMTEVLKSIITEIDPNNPLLRIPMPTVFDPDPEEPSESYDNELINKPTAGTGQSKGRAESKSKNPPSAKAARLLGMGSSAEAETLAEGKT
jgi:hypothetical protein